MLTKVSDSGAVMSYWQTAPFAFRSLVAIWPLAGLTPPGSPAHPGSSPECGTDWPKPVDSKDRASPDRRARIVSGSARIDHCKHPGLVAMCKKCTLLERPRSERGRWDGLHRQSSAKPVGRHSPASLTRWPGFLIPPTHISSKPDGGDLK